MTAADLLQFLVTANITAGIAILVVLVLRGSIRRLAGARVAYMSWLIVPAAIAAGFLPARVVTLPSPHAADPVAMHSPASGGGDTPFAPHVIAPLDSSPAIHPIATAASIDWMLVLTFVWAFGALGAIAWLTATQFAAVRALGPLTRISPTTFRAARSALGPAVVGILAPRIVLPADFEQTYDEAERKVVLAHEETHLRDRHTAAKALVHILACLNWFNPLAWIAARAVAMDQELACDDAVAARYPSERRVYAEVLVKAQSGLRAPLGCYWPVNPASKLKTRIARLSAAKPSAKRRMAGVGALALLVVVAGCTAWSAKPPEQRIADAKDAQPTFVAVPDAPAAGQLADLSDYFLIRGEVVRAEGAYIWVKAKAISRKGSDPKPSTEVWRLSLDSLLRGAPLERPADMPADRVFHSPNDGHDHKPKVGSVAQFQGYVLANTCKPECNGFVTAIWASNTGGWPSDPGRTNVSTSGKDAAFRGPVVNPVFSSPDPDPAPRQTAPAGYDRNDTIYIRGKVEKIEFGATTYALFVRSEAYGADPYSLAELKQDLFALSAINYFGDPENRKEITASMTGRKLDVWAYRATDKSCQPACRVYTREIFERDDKGEITQIGFGGLKGQSILDEIMDPLAAVTLKGKIIRFDNTIESASPHGVLWIEATNVDTTKPDRSPPDGVWRVAGFPQNLIQSNFWVGREVTINGYATKKGCRAEPGACIIIGKQIS